MMLSMRECRYRRGQGFGKDRGVWHRAVLVPVGIIGDGEPMRIRVGDIVPGHDG